MLLVIPVEDKPSWRRPPVVCVVLILLNLGLYGFLAMADSRIAAQAARTYQESGIVEQEWPLYLAYLEERQPERWARLQGIPPDAREAIAERTLLFDRGFDTWLQAHAHGNRDNAAWKQARRVFEQQRDQLSMFRFGLTPGDLHVENLFTNMFMHGSWDHVIGNMLFLALFGVALEARLGHSLFLALYLLGGVLSNADALLSPGEMQPSVGASGAIAALMGMYVGIYGARVREFFVMLGPWIGSLRMPALIVFPLWLGKELLDALFVNDGVGHMAHAAGLIAGLLIVLPFRKRTPGLPSPGTADAEPGVPAAAPAISARLQQLAESGQFEKAVKACEARLESGPGSEALWSFYLDNAARAGNESLLHAAGRLLATINGATPDYGTAARGYLKLKELRAELRRLSPQHRLLQCELLLHMSRIDEAHAVLNALLDGNWRHPRLTRTALDIASRLPDPRDSAAIRRKVQPATPAAGQ